MSYLLLAQGAAESTRELPLSAEAIGLVALIGFIALLGLTWTFRNTSNKRH
jgi:hypothetical protein